MAAAAGAAPEPGQADALRVQIASDLHLEFYDILPPLEKFLCPSAQVLALLGDICALGHRRGMKMYEDFLGQCCKHFDTVLILVGNHEFYSNEVSRTTSDEILAFMRSMSAKYPKVQLLENEGITLNGVRVVGTALWSAVPEEQTIDGASRLGLDQGSTVEFSMNDYRLVYVAEGQELTPPLMPLGALPVRHEIAPPPTPGAALPIPSRADLNSTTTTIRGEALSMSHRVACVEDTNAWHAIALSFLKAEAMEATTRGMNLLVLTHHTPSFHGTSNPRYGCEPRGLSTAFSTDLEYMLKDPCMAAIHTWCFGHTHYNSDQKIHDRRLVSNQLGYPENPSRGYKRDFVVEVPVAFKARAAARRAAPPPGAGSGAERCNMV